MQNVVYGLYLVPSVFVGKKSSCKRGNIDWGGPHITLVSFRASNEYHLNKLSRMLSTYKVSGELWRPNYKGVQKSSYEYIINSKSLGRFSEFLKQFGLESVQDIWKYGCEGVVLDKPTSHNSWSLVVAKRDGKLVTWSDELTPFYLNHGDYMFGSISHQFNVMTWNLSYEAISGKDFGVKCGNKDKNGVNNCVKNFLNLVPNKVCSLIGLQEIYHPKLLINNSGYLKSMGSIYSGDYSKNKIAGLLLFYCKHRFSLINDLVLVYGFGGIGRPLMIVPLKDNITGQVYVVINIHPGHGVSNSGRPNTLEYFETYVNEYKNLDNHVYDEIMKFIINPGNRIIMMGDMNNNKPLSSIFGRKMYGGTDVITCCDESLSGDPISPHPRYGSSMFDHIIYSDPYIKTYVYHHSKMISDHLPVLGTIYNNHEIINAFFSENPYKPIDDVLIVNYVEEYYGVQFLSDGTRIANSDGYKLVGDDWKKILNMLRTKLGFKNF